MNKKIMQSLAYLSINFDWVDRTVNTQTWRYLCTARKEILHKSKKCCYNCITNSKRHYPVPVGRYLLRNYRDCTLLRIGHNLPFLR